MATTRRALLDSAKATDVRTPQEYSAGRLQGALNVDLSAPSFDRRINTLDSEADYVVYCASGRRAAEAIQRMREAGSTGVLVNAGGYQELASAGLDTGSGCPEGTGHHLPSSPEQAIRAGSVAAGWTRGPSGP